MFEPTDEQIEALTFDVANLIEPVHRAEVLAMVRRDAFQAIIRAAQAEAREVTEALTRTRVYGPFPRDRSSGYVLEQSKEGWRRVWVEPGEPDEEGPWLTTKAQAFREAADDWDACGMPGTTLAARLRSLATKADRESADV